MTNEPYATNEKGTNFTNSSERKEQMKSRGSS